MNRRNFLRTAGLGAALAAVSPISSISAFGQPTTKNVVPTGRMKLTFEPYTLKLKHAFNLAKNQRTTTPGVQVRIQLDGITGYGEASMPPYLGENVDSVMSFLSKVDLGQFADPFRVVDIHEYIDNLAPRNSAAKASVDIALHDVLGKIMGQPWYKIWGLNPDKTPNTSYTISYQSDPHEMAKEIEETKPFRIVKVKMGLDHDKELVNLLRKTSDTQICVDANQGWDTKEKALEMCKWLADNNCAFVEQPLPKEMFAETAWLRERSPLPIIADEAFQRITDIRKLSEAYDGVNIKLMKSTGLHEAHQMAQLARNLGMKVMIGCMTETSAAVTAAAQLSPMCDWADLDGNLLIANDIFDGIKIVDGKVTIPADRPGIGVIPKA